MPEDHNNRNIVVFYDANCIDGGASYWVFQKKFADNPDVTIQPVPLPRTSPENSSKIIFDNITEGDDVFFVDTCPNIPDLEQLLSPCKDSKEGEPKRCVNSVTVWDHHKSSAEKMDDFKPPHIDGFDPPEYQQLIDLDASAAAILVWNNLFDNEDPPEVFEWIGKAEPPTDLRNDKEKAIVAYIDSKDIRTPESVVATISELIETSQSHMIEKGQSIKDDQDNNIKKMLQNVTYTHLSLLPGLTKKWMPIVNASADNFGRNVNAALIREGELGTSAGIAGAWQLLGDGTVKLSLRSRGTPDVSKIAEYLGETIGCSGGGHPTDAVVQFSNITQFIENVPIYTKEQMQTMQWDTEFNEQALAEVTETLDMDNDGSDLSKPDAAQQSDTSENAGEVVTVSPANDDGQNQQLTQSSKVNANQRISPI